MTDIALTWSEIRYAAHIGIDRFVRNRAANRPCTYGVDPNLWQPDVLGAWGELAVAKATDTYWTGDLGRTDGGAPDIGSWHVRTVDTPDKRLLLHPSDDDHGAFVLVQLVKLPRFRIAGWCYGRDGKLPDYWQTFTGRPAYFVPTSALEDWDEPGHLDTWKSLTREAV